MIRRSAVLATLVAFAAAVPATAATKHVRDPRNGSTIVLRAGDDVVIDLFANETTPYHWVVARRPSRRIARIVSMTYVPPSNVPPGVTGASGRELVRVHARHRGRTTFVLAYTQLGQPARRGQPLRLHLRVH